MPKRRTASANKPKQMTVMTMQASNAGQNPRRVSNTGNARNIGRVGTTYQNVYQAWFAIFSVGCLSTYSQISAITVTSGSAETKPPSLSLRFASSETSTTTAAVTKYLVIIQATCFTQRCLCRRD